VDIENFRGIAALSWRIPKNRNFFALIGPGDSAKSTILTAIDMALSDRWSLSITDTDFHDGDIETPIHIQVALGDLPAAVRHHGALGLHLAGIDDAGNVYDGPDDDHDPCLLISLTIDKNLEPDWTAHQPNNPESAVNITAAARRLLGSYRVDERIDNHLRWSRMSALGRLTDTQHGADELLLSASRQARNAVADSIPPELASLVATVQKRLHALGSGEFTDLRPGLDQSLSTSTGNLALYEGPVPLTNFGLGSRRLAGVAVQQLANADKGILLIDEVEYGLEPHRLVNLLMNLRQRTDSSLTLATTHSPTALQHLDVSDLGIIRLDRDGTATVRTFDDTDDQIQKLLRSSPEAFFARKVVLTEGKTEYGILLEFLAAWDHNRSQTGKPSAAALGTVGVEGNGGSGSIEWARTLNTVGYEVVLFMDSDVPTDCAKADALQDDGVIVVRWNDGFNTERAIVEALDDAGLAAFIETAIELSDDPSSSRRNFLDHLHSHGLPTTIMSLQVDSWLASGISLAIARQVTADTAHKHNWYKRVAKGRALVALLTTSPDFPTSETATKLLALQRAVFGTSHTSADDVPKLAATETTDPS
jgi:hypothetical protein